MADVSKILKETLQQKQEELQRLVKEVEVLRSLIQMAESQSEAPPDADPGAPFPPQRANSPAKDKRVKRFP